MKKNQLITLILIFAVLSALVFVKQMQKPKELATQEYVPLDIKVDPKSVTSVEIIKPIGKEEEFVDLKKTGTQWNLKSLSNARADENKIEELLKEVQKIQGEMRANDKALLKDFEIQDDQAVRITLKGSDSKTLLDLMVGLKKPDNRTTFIRKAGSNAIYLTPADIFGKLGIFGTPKDEKIDNQYWASSALCDIPTEKIAGLEVKHIMNGKDDVRASIYRQASASDPSKKEWKYTRTDLPFELDANKAQTFFSSFKTWRAQKVIDPKKGDNFEFDKSTWQLTFKLDDGKSVVIKAGKTDKDAGATYMQVSSEPVVFLLSGYYYENMDTDDSRFFADNPLGIENAKISKLVVTTDKNRWEVSPKTKTWDSLSQYLDELKNFNVSRLLFQSEDLKKVRTPSKFSIEITKEGAAAPVTLDFGDLTKESPKEYAVVVRGKHAPFSVSEVIRNNAFDKTDRLSPPPPPKTENVPAAPKPAPAKS